MITITVDGYELDKEQMEAVCSNSKYILIVAGAGSGKTTTIIGKIKYLILNGTNPNDVLCISFTNATVTNLKEKIKKETGMLIDVYTFHKLSMNILDNYKVRYKICASDFLDYLVKEYLENIILNDNNMMYIVLKYFNLSTVKINILKKYKKLLSDGKIEKLIRLVTKFIRLMKTNGYNIYSFNRFYKSKFKTKRFYFLKLVLILYQKYQNELESMGELDFDDLIIEASSLVSSFDYQKYKYVIIDEFQDSSMIRFELINNIIKKSNASLFLVGDDFQSIYKFAGCDLRIMLDFNKRFKDGSIYKITNTYRNSQELIDIAGSFVMKNKNQIKKNLVSSKKLSSPIKIIRYNNYKKDFKKLLEKISVKNSILVLGRNNKDIYKLLDEDYNIYSDCIVYIPKNIEFKYMTIHKSKGLEAEVVIIINLIDDIMGFPSKLEDDKILSIVSSNIDNYPYSEERRLFYVALTRTKGYVYLYVPKYNESVFIKEIKKIGKIRG